MRRRSIHPPLSAPPRLRTATAGWALPLLLLGALAGCAGAPPPPPSPRPHPSPSHPAYGILPLGGMAPPLTLQGPYALGSLPGGTPAAEPVAPVPYNPTTAVRTLVRALRIPGPPIAVGGGMAYNLGASSGLQLTVTAGLGIFRLHPNHPVFEPGVAPTIAQADLTTRRFLGRYHLPGPGDGLRLLPAATATYGADRRIVYQWTVLGRPQVSITGAAALLSVDVATDPQGRHAVMGMQGSVPYPVTGPTVPYPLAPPRAVGLAVARGQILPAAYRLSPAGQPYAPSTAPPLTVPARLTGVRLATVISGGFAIPVYVFQVLGRPGITRFVACAVPRVDCLPLRYGRRGHAPATPSP